MDRMTPENRYVITYEGLTDDLIGAEVTKGLNEFLGRAEGVEPIDRESVPCIWKAVVKNQPPEHQKEQIDKLVKAKAGSESELGGKVASSGGSAPAGKDSVGSAPNVANGALAMETNAAMSPEGQQMTEITSEKKIWNGDEKPLQTVYLDQTQQQIKQHQGVGLQMPADTQQMFQQMPPQSQMQFQQMPAENQMQFQQPQMQQFGQYPEMQQQFQQPQMQQFGQYPEMQQQFQQPQMQQFGQYPEMQQQFQQQQQQPMQMQYQQPGNLRHRRLDPGHHDSQRKGPNVPRPYTVKQLELMMQMLKELGDRYQDDVRLTNIMQGYYEKVQKARDELGGKPMAPPGGFF
jgi:hypothetical protein